MGQPFCISRNVNNCAKFGENMQMTIWRWPRNQKIEIGS